MTEKDVMNYSNTMPAVTLYTSGGQIRVCVTDGGRLRVTEAYPDQMKTVCVSGVPIFFVAELVKDENGQWNVSPVGGKAYIRITVPQGIDTEKYQELATPLLHMILPVIQVWADHNPNILVKGQIAYLAHKARMDMLEIESAERERDRIEVKMMTLRTGVRETMKKIRQLEVEDQVEEVFSNATFNSQSA